MKRETTIWTLLGGIVLLVALSPLIYLFAGPWLDDRAEETATTTCSKVQIGAPVSTFIALAKTYDEYLIEGVTEDDGGVRYEAQFSGFGANKYTCSVYTKGQIVLSKLTDEHTW